MKKIGILLVLAMTLVFSQGKGWAADAFSIGIMQAKTGEAEKYAPLIKYFQSKDIEIKLKGYGNYMDAAAKFSAGDVHAMFAGSGVAGTMIIKDLVVPVVRPVNKEGWSTYYAVILAPKGSPKFTGDPAYFPGKNLICAALASSGEFYARSVLGKDAELMEAASHGAAIASLAKGVADIAIVKNRTWDVMKKDYPGIEKVGQDEGENPDGTLIVSKNADSCSVAKIRQTLLGLSEDPSPEAMEVKKAMEALGFIPTGLEDFKHTIAMLEKAGVTANFDFGAR